MKRGKRLDPKAKSIDLYPDQGDESYRAPGDLGRKKKLDPSAETVDLHGDVEEEESSFLGDTLNNAINLVDIPGAASRSLIAGEGKEHLQNIWDEGLMDASGMAPTEEDIARQFHVVDDDTSDLGKFGASVGTGFVTDPLTYGTLGIAPLVKSTLKRVFKGQMAKQASKAMAKISKLTKSDVTRMNMDAEVMGETIVREDLSRYIKNPARILEKLGGRRPVKITPTSAGELVEKGRDAANPGMIAEISDDLGSMISQVSTGHKGVTRSDIGVPVFESFLKEATGKTSGQAIGPEMLAAIKKELSGIVKPGDYSIEDLYKLKKELGKQLSSPVFFQPADKALAMTKDVKLRTQRVLDDLIKKNLETSNIMDGAKSINASEYYKFQNNRMSRMINIRDVLQMIPSTELKKPSMAANVAGLVTQGAIGAGAGAGFSAVTGTPLMSSAASGMALTGGLSAARKAGHEVTKNFPENAMRAMELTQDIAPVTIPFAPQAAREMRPDERPYSMDRSPDALPRQSANLPLQLIKTKLPRTVEGVMENSQVLLAKVAQQMPDALDAVKFVIEERPEDLEEMLPFVMQMVPQAFESDKYNRINGKILDPLMQQKAREDLMEDERLSNTQRINMIDKLNRSNELEGY